MAQKLHKMECEREQEGVNKRKYKSWKTQRNSARKIESKKEIKQEGKMECEKDRMHQRKIKSRKKERMQARMNGGKREGRHLEASR